MAGYENIKTPPLTNGDKILKAPLDDKRYLDWAEDDTQRDPTPSNQRRTEMMKMTFPKNGDNKVSKRGK